MKNSFCLPKGAGVVRKWGQTHLSDAQLGQCEVDMLPEAGEYFVYASPSAAPLLCLSFFLPFATAIAMSHWSRNMPVAGKAVSFPAATST